MKRARFVSGATREFLAEVAYYEEAQPGEGAHFIDAVRYAVARALAFPSSGSPAAAGTRRTLVRDFPFSVIYRVESDGILVVAIAHSAKRPGYWQTRVR